MTTTIRGTTSIQHPLGRDSSIPKKIEEGRLLYLTKRIRDGSITRDEREELGRGFIRLAIKIAASYAARCPNKGDDYASAGLFGIAHALDKAREKLVDDNITGWVIANIRRFIRRFYERDHMVRTPARTYHRAAVTGQTLEAPTVLLIDSRELSDWKNQKSSFLYQRVKPQPKSGVRELREMLDMAARDDRDRAILKMRSEGFTDCEIGQRMGLSTSYIQRKRAEIEARFNRLNEE